MAHCSSLLLGSSKGGAIGGRALAPPPQAGTPSPRPSQRPPPSRGYRPAPRLWAPNEKQGQAPCETENRGRMRTP